MLIGLIVRRMNDFFDVRFICCEPEFDAGQVAASAQVE
jgi:hypothetical protein